MEKKSLLSRTKTAINARKDKEIADFLGVSTSTYSNWNTGVSNPDYDLIFKKMEDIGINLHWLITGEGPMLVQDVQTATSEAGADPESSRYATIGRALCNLMELIGVEVKKGVAADPADKMVTDLMAKSKKMRAPGPAPDLTEEELARIQGRQNSCHNGE